MARRREAKSKPRKASGRKSTSNKKKLESKKKAAKKKAAKKKSARKKSVARKRTRKYAARKRAPRTAVAANPADEVPIPPRDTFNIGLHSASEATMLQLLGVPGRKTPECSDPTGPFASRIKFGVNVGPFRVSGLDFAVASLKAVFDEARKSIPSVVAAAKTQGMLCVRHKRNNPNSFSNHSWGAALDVFFGARVVPQGTPKTHRGVLQLMPYFNRHGWYWGAGFSGDAVDSMHFELAEETIRNAERASLVAST